VSRESDRETGNGKRETKPFTSRPFHEDLDVYRVARALAIDLYRDTARFPISERYGLTAQIRRAVVSISANIAEGAGRRSKKEFAQFLSIARGSTTELRILLDIATEIGELPRARFQHHSQTLDRVFAMTSGLLKRTLA
jgi:four helix bundle protein